MSLWFHCSSFFENVVHFTAKTILYVEVYKGFIYEEGRGTSLIISLMLWLKSELDPVFHPCFHEPHLDPFHCYRSQKWEFLNLEEIKGNSFSAVNCLSHSSGTFFKKNSDFSTGFLYKNSISTICQLEKIWYHVKLIS